MNETLSECDRERAASKLAVLLDLHTRLKRGLREAGGESLLLRCHKAMSVVRLDQSNVPWPTIDVCRRRDTDFLLSSKLLAISDEDIDILARSI
jgi:hypothetical protein